VVLPVRTNQVVRRRIADALITLGDLLRSVRRDPARLDALGARFDGQVELIREVAKPVETQRLFLHRLPRHRLLRRSRLARRLDPDAPHLADAIDAVLRCVEPVRTLVEEATAADRVPGDRRIMGLVGTVKSEIDDARRVLSPLTGPAVPAPVLPGPGLVAASGDGCPAPDR
jgi:hypothetical protein